MEKVYAFTKKYNELTRVLTLPVQISLVGSNGIYETQGIIDTGAICSVVSMNLVEKLGGIPFSYLQARNVLSGWIFYRLATLRFLISRVKPASLFVFLRYRILFLQMLDFDLSAERSLRL